MGGLTIDVKDQQGVRRIALRGAIDDRVDYGKLAGLAAPVMVFDFDKVESINSFGVKGWMGLIKALEKSKLVFERCPTVIIESINLIGQLRGGAEITSFYLPFSCRSCDSEVNLLTTKEQALDPDFIDTINDRYPCPSCTRKLEFIDDETVYFDFLKG